MKEIVKYISVLVLLMVVLPLSVSAQNSIDKLVDHYSTLGSSTFTSVVERDPDTKQIQKVVKVLEMPDLLIGRFRKAFLGEKNSGTFAQQQKNDEQTMTLTTETSRQVRIYMLRFRGHRTYHSGKVTIIVRMKAAPRE